MMHYLTFCSLALLACLLVSCNTSFIESTSSDQIDTTKIQSTEKALVSVQNIYYNPSEINSNAYKEFIPDSSHIRSLLQTNLERALSQKTLTTITSKPLKKDH